MLHYTTLYILLVTYNDCIANFRIGAYLFDCPGLLPFQVHIRNNEMTAGGGSSASHCFHFLLQKLLVVHSLRAICTSDLSTNLNDSNFFTHHPCFHCSLLLNAIVYNCFEPDLVLNRKGDRNSQLRKSRRRAIFCFLLLYYRRRRETK